MRIINSVQWLHLRGSDMSNSEQPGEVCRWPPGPSAREERSQRATSPAEVQIFCTVAIARRSHCDRTSLASTKAAQHVDHTAGAVVDCTSAELGSFSSGDGKHDRQEHLNHAPEPHSEHAPLAGKRERPLTRTSERRSPQTSLRSAPTPSSFFALLPGRFLHRVVPA